MTKSQAFSITSLTLVCKIGVSLYVVVVEWSVLCRIRSVLSLKVRTHQFDVNGIVVLRLTENLYLR